LAASACGELLASAQQPVARVVAVLAPTEVQAAAAGSLGRTGAAFSLALATNRIERGGRAADQVEGVDHDRCVG
jgi:hypothetical protein